MENIIKKTVAVIICVTAVSTLVVASGRIYSYMAEPQQRKSEASITELSAENDVQAPPAPEMLQKVLRSVVGISSESRSYSGEAVQFSGSGVIVTENGYIITNHHVIGSHPRKIEVTLSDGDIKTGKTIWSDSTLDLAVVKIAGSGYTYSKMGDAKTLRVGESVCAIGNPLSMQFERTVTAGIVSAVGRSINIENENGEAYYMEDLIQTDASINPGNSGGPLVNEAGEVIGINTVKVTSAEGMGFAVPVNVCVPVIKRIITQGTFETPYLGLYAYTPAAARYFGKEKNIIAGMFTAGLDTRGPAFRAGLRYGDIIKGINGKHISTMLELREELFKFQKGEGVNIEYERNGEIKTVLVKL